MPRTVCLLGLVVWLLWPMAARAQPAESEDQAWQQIRPPPYAPRPAGGETAAPAVESTATGSLQLAPRQTRSTRLTRPDEGDSDSPTIATPLVTTMGSLAVVLGLFLVAAWCMRRTAPVATLLLPSEVVETLGRAPLPGRNQMHLVRCGSKLLLVCISAAGVETLTEITDPAEVDRLAGICRQAHPHSATAAFRNVLQQFARERNQDLLETDDV